MIHTLRVRYGECDPQGVVFNANWFLFFDVGLTELWREALGGWDPERLGADFMAVHAEADFRGSARFDDVVDLEVLVERIGTSSVSLVFAARRDGELLVEGRTVHVAVRPGTHEVVPVPEGVRAGLAPYARSTTTPS